ncbi:hypothetical protein, partial [Actinomadura miaoliensis]|uniref:hypothetical protein n=1 Tax=Actinomadura miaoliensis TaxID=430685 RepID=UPI0031F1563A
MSEKGRFRRPRGRVTMAVAGVVGAGVLGTGIWLGAAAGTDAADTTDAAKVAARGTLGPSAPPVRPDRPATPSARPSAPPQPTAAPQPPTT